MSKRLIAFLDGLNSFGASPLKRTFKPEPQTWYYLILAIGPEGQFIARIWDPNNPYNHVTYLEMFDTTWQDLSWKFQILCTQGRVLIDDFMEIEFDEVLIQ